MGNQLNPALDLLEVFGNAGEIRDDAEEELERLLSEGANVNQIDKKSGCSVLANAAGAQTPWASMVVAKLIEEGADVHVVDFRGLTALMRAAAVGDGDVCKILIRAGADKTLKDEDGKTARDWAQDHQFYHCCDILDLDAG